ncbi:MAG: EamA family transporter [Acidimicrobiia bacterium]|nr:EamA family transporter [Acidimicrobiia bacterium]
MVVGLAIVAAATLGAADYLAGVALRRDGRTESAVTYAAASVFVGLVIVVAAVPLAPPDHFGRTDLLWSIAAGVAIGLAVPLVMVGMSKGPIAVVAPVIGLVSLAVPAIVGPLVGDQLSNLELSGLLMALPATAMVATSPRSSSRGLSIPWALLLAAATGCLFGSAAIFFGQTSQDSGIGPAAAAQVMASVLLVSMAVSTGRLLRPTRHALKPAVLGGGLAAVAALASVLAYQRGPVAVVAAVVGLRPGLTVLLAWFLIHERINRIQLVGFALGVGAVMLFAVG